jgi:uncharacterized phiE125 gp8 family phage protein
MSLILTTPPATEPITLAEAKAHLKVDTTDDDTLIGTLIFAARSRAELLTSRAFISQGWTLWLDAWPCGAIEIPIAPLQNIASITVYAPDDSANVLDASAYQIDAASAPARVALKETALPPLNLRRINAIEIVFTAGYGDAESDVPSPIREATVELVADSYANRGDVSGDTPLGAMALLAPYRLINI